ncbi:sacsin N-terminal ATP-binding-like domain-containing protein [Rhodococcoides corynebacterioides]|uniref:sacsin N-terminal ATP-binding-like domain-containing protein n=1 Tax=Rhodococcoides corynebacterioides TaxID=53972 RepID=UPI003AEBCFA0
MTDPFGTAALRRAVLDAWAASPTRLIEDAAVEHDLVVGGYRDRAVTELIQNAADAARRADVPGRVALRLEGSTLHCTNAGAPLTVSGVRALSALRASDKGGGDVGRYGVGFTAVRALTARVEVRSLTGSIVFDAEATRRALRENGIDDAVLAARGLDVPMFRLPWPSDGTPTAGWDTEIVLHHVADAEAVLDTATAEAGDLLLELPTIDRITVGDHDIGRVEAAGPGAWSTVTVGERSYLRGVAPHATWYLPVGADGEVLPVETDVLRAPTRSDEVTTLPAVVVADVPMQPDRRRVLPGADPAPLADGYGALVADLPPAARYLAVPRPAVPASAVDGVLREALTAELTETAWVPGVDGRSYPPRAVTVVDRLTDDLAALLADVIPGLAEPAVSDGDAARTLARLGARVLRPAETVETLSGLARPPSWWRSVYAAFDALLPGSEVAECAAIPVPLTDGRTVTGPRTVVVAEERVGAVSWARVAHPDAVHPLLRRLGATPARAVDLLADPVLAERLVDPDGVPDALVDEVLAVASLAPEHTTVPGLGELPLRDEAGADRAADELLLPDAPVLAVLSEDHPFGVVHPELLVRHGVHALRVVGVGTTFGTVVDDTPLGPDHDLDDEDAWWDSVDGEPGDVRAVRDLEWVDPDRWAATLDLLVADPTLGPLLTDRNGYTAWWLRRHAEIDGTPLGLLRRPDDDTFAGVLDVAPALRAVTVPALWARDRVDDAVTARALLARLGDAERPVRPGVVVRTYAALGEAVAADRVDVRDVDPPDEVRTLAGRVVRADDVTVLGGSSWIAVVPPDRAVPGGAHPDAVADLLDLDTTAALTVTVRGGGDVVAVADDPMLAAYAAAVTDALPSLALPSEIVVHDDLVVTASGIGERRVPYWVDPDGTVHLERIR